MALTHTAAPNQALQIFQAVTQMEERLQRFVDTNKTIEGDEVESDGTARFVHHQVLELARDCLQKSQEKMISSTYFYELSENLERLLHDVSIIRMALSHYLLIKSGRVFA